MPIAGVPAIAGDNPFQLCDFYSSRLATWGVSAGFDFIPAHPMTFPRRLLHPLLLTCLAGSLPSEAADDPVDKVGKVAVEWVKTRTETVRLETEWSSQRELLQATIKAMEERARLAEESVELVKARTAQDRAEIEAIENRNDAAEKNHAAAAAHLQDTTRNLLGLRSSLPPRLLAALELPYKSLQDPALPASERFQHTLTILNRCLQFNRVVTTGEEVLTLPGESAPKALEVIYWGLSHGYALDRPAGKAWVGVPGPQGWEWEARPEAAGDLARVLAMTADKADPAFVMMPGKIAHPNR